MLPEKKNRKSKRRAGLLSRTVKRFKAQDMTRRVAALPSRFTRHRCAVTGQFYLKEWRKERLDGLYKFERVIFAQAGQSDAPSAAMQTGEIALSEFDWPDDDCCEICGHDRQFVLCAAGVLVCGGRTTFHKNGRHLFRCHESCGERFQVGGTVTALPASEGQSANGKALPGNSKVKALPKQTRLLSGSKS